MGIDQGFVSKIESGQVEARTVVSIAILPRWNT
jgi:hypothetical protein